MGLPQPPQVPPSWRVVPWSTTPTTDAVNIGWGDLHTLLAGVHPQQMYALGISAYVAGGIW